MATATPPEVGYPSSDGQPMAETGIHVLAIMALHQALQDVFVDRPDVFIASDMFWYWVEGNRDIKIAPDVMVVPGVGNHQRRSFFTWREGGAVPAAVFEMASEGTWDDDETKKFKKYQELKVREYFIFDPEALYLSSPLKGYRLRAGKYHPIRPEGGRLASKLGFGLRPEGTMLRLSHPDGRPVLTRAEQVEEAQRHARAAIENARAAEEHARAAEEHADAVQQRADALQAEVERLRALLPPPPNGNGS